MEMKVVKKFSVYTTHQMKGDPYTKFAKLLQSCPTLCDPIDGSPPGSPVPGILQARILEWVAISFSNARKWKVKVKSLSRVRPPATPWTAVYQAPPSMGFSRQEHWSGVPLPLFISMQKTPEEGRSYIRFLILMKTVFLGSDISLEPTSNLAGSTLPRAQGSRTDKDSRFNC